MSNPTRDPEQQGFPVELITTAEGSHTLYRPDLQEVYHSRYGAVQESAYVYVQHGFRRIQKSSIRVFEVGFGTGLNALLTCIESTQHQILTVYDSIEKYPLNKNVIQQLNYPAYLADTHAFFKKLHKAGWNQTVAISPLFSLQKINGDLTTYELNQKYDLIYFDAFAPDVQPELWNSEIFTKMAGALVTGGILVTYAARSGIFKSLEQSGFRTAHIPGPPGKREITVAVKI